MAMKPRGNYTANYIRVLRHEAGRSQDEIADFLGVRRSTYSHYETGRLHLSAEKLALLAAYYQVSLDSLCLVPESAGGIGREKRPEKSKLQEVTVDDMTLISAYHRLTDTEQRAVRRMIQEMTGE